MAEEVKQKVNELTTQTPSLADFLLGIGASAGSTEYKMLINDLARAIIEQYTGSTVAGSAQSIKAALDALNSNFYGLSYSGMTFISSGDDLNTYTTPGSFCSVSSAITNSLSNVPFTGNGFSLHVESVAGATGQYVIQTINRIYNNTDSESYTRIRKPNDSAWGDWIKSPKRSEVDTLNSRLWKHIEMGDHRTLTLHFTTGFVSLFVYGTGSGMTPFMAAITASPDESSILVNPTTRNITVSGNRSSVVVTFPASWYNTWFSSDYEFTYEIS